MNKKPFSGLSQLASHIKSSKIAKFLLIAGLIVWLKNYQQTRANQEHSSMDFAWNIDQLHTRDLLNYLVVSGQFDNKYYRKIHEKSGIDIDLFDNLNHTKNIFLHAKNYPSIEEKKKAIADIRKQSNMPILIHTDFEWGYVHSINIISEDGAEKFGIPEQIMLYRNQQSDEESSSLSALPSSEYLGKIYKQIVLSGDHQARLDFIRMMEQYGKSIRKIMQYIDVDVVYGPNADIVDDLDAKWEKNYIASEWRSYADHFIIWQDLVSAFINGFQSNYNSILLVPKHFVWVGKSKNPHQSTDVSDMNKNDWSIAIFKNIINGKNQFLDTSHINHCYNLAKQREPQSDYTLYLKKNIAFIKRLAHKNINLSWWDPIDAVMTTHISGDKNIVWSDQTITYSSTILDILKTKIGAKNPLSDGFVISDDLWMQWADEWLEQLNISASQENRIISALAAWHDMVLFLETDPLGSKDIDKTLDIVADMIDSGVDLNNDGNPDLTRADLLEKTEKMMDLMSEQWRIKKSSPWRYQLNDATSYDINITKILRDSWLSNQWFITWASIQDYKNEKNGMKDFLQKKLKSLYESAAHNFPNALYKYLTMDEKYTEALNAGKKLIIVDKSEEQLYIFTLDWKELIESYPIGLGKWSSKKDHTHDRRILGDNKTPVWNYMVVNKIMGEEQYKHFSRDDIDIKGYYGWPKWGLLTLIGPWTPYIALHGSIEQKTGPLSNACVRVIDPGEVSWKTNIKDQKLINHLAETVPVGSYVIITN